MSLRERTSSALGWRFVTISCKFLLQLALGIILSRILPVDAFGLLGMSMVIVGAASVVQEIGTAPALVQRRILTEKHIHVGFTISIIWGFLLTLLVWFGAPTVGAVFGLESVVPILRLLSLTLFITSLGTTTAALLQRELDFKNLLVADVVSYAIGYAFVGIPLAVLGYDVWSLVWAAIVQTISRTALLFVLSKHRLLPSFSVREAKELLRFGLGISLARIANYSARNGDYFVVGRWLGPIELGLYSRAYQLMTVPISEFSSVIGFVLFPAYAKIQDDPTRLKRAYLESVSLAALVVFPLLTYMAVVGPELIRGLFGPKWMGATGAFQILCIGGLFRSMYNCGDALARAMGAVYAQFARHLLYAVFVVIGSIIGCRYGIEGVAFGVLFALFSMYLMTANLSLRLLRMGWYDYIRAQLPAIVFSILSAAVALLMTAVMRNWGVPDLIIMVGVGLAVIVVLGTIVAICPTLRASALLRNALRGAIRFLK